MSEKKALDDLFKLYRLFSRSILTAFILYKDDWSEHWIVGPNACHSSLNRATVRGGAAEPNKWDHLITAMPKHDVIDMRYYDWLILGPFKAFSDLIQLDHVGDNWFIRCKHLDKWPANVLYNFCIASRVPIENRRTMDAWELFLSAGVDPSVAYIAAAEFFKTSYAYDKHEHGTSDLKKTIGDPWSYKITGEPYNFDHAWFGNTVDYMTVLKGEMLVDKFSKPYRSNPTDCKPCNVIWGKRTPTDKSVVGKTVEEISLALGLPGKPQPKSRRKSKKSIADMAIDEYMRYLHDKNVMNIHQVVEPQPQ